MPDSTDALRPGRLDDFDGQPDISSQLGLILAAARKRGEPPGHLCFAGPPGLGKTTLANIVAAELGYPIVVTSGPAVDKPADLVGNLPMNPNGPPVVVFVDEIHRLKPATEEMLYPAMEDGELDIVVGEGTARARTVRVPLGRFVLVGATTQEGMLSGPLRDRFTYVGRLRPYDLDALAGIVARAAGRLGIDLDPDAAERIASRGRGTPRVALTLLRRVQDWSEVNELGSVGAGAVDAALDLFGVDRIGLDRPGRDYLHALCVTHRGGPAGVNALAAAIGESPSTLEEVYEPFLLRNGLIARTLRGRIATAEAYEHLGLKPPATLLLNAADTLDFGEEGAA